MQQSKTKSLILIGFGVMSFILVILVSFWIQSVNLSENRLNKIINEQNKLNLIDTMKEITYKRAVSILRMSAMNDMIDRSDEYNKFKLLASGFIEARDELVKAYFNQEDYNEWVTVVPYVRDASNVQNKVADLLLENRNEIAGDLIIREVLPRQDDLNAALTEFTVKVGTEIDRVSSEAISYNKKLYIIIVFLVLVALLIGFTVARFVVESSLRSEKIILDTGDKIRKLYEVSSETGMSDQEQIIKMLSLGCEMLDMEAGTISRLDNLTQRLTVRYVSASNFNVKPGASMPTRESLCGFVLGISEPLAINDIGKSEFNYFQNFNKHNIRSYIAKSLVIKGKKFGTLSFVSKKVRDKVFTGADTDLVNLIASWVVFAIERSIDHEELTSLKDAAENANKAKSEFLGNMSHELRTPMHAILSYAGFGVRRYNTATDVKKLGYFEKIQKSAGGLLNLLNNILDLAKLESGKMEFEIREGDIYGVTLDIIDEVSGLCDEKKIKIRILQERLVDKVALDTDRIKQVIRNIIGNAIKFSPHGSTISVHIEETQGNLKYSVSDKGPGIPENELNGIFNKFIQSSATKNGAGGTGLGLSISKEIISAHNGYIWADNNEAGGATFVFMIPMRHAPFEVVNVKKYA